MILAHDVIDRMTGFARRRPVVAAVRFALALLVFWGLAMLTKRPLLDREWVEHLAHTPGIAAQNNGADGWRIRHVRDWAYDAAGPTSKSAALAAFDLADVRRVWFVLEPHPSLERLMAHTLVLFELPNDQLLGLTIEARRETHERYSALAGAFNAFELAYVWASAKDLLTRRAVYLQHELRIYPIEISAGERAAFARVLLEKTRGLETRPRFYNTLLSNCTNELAKTAGLGWSPSFVLTGQSDRRLFRDGLIPGSSLEAARAQAEIGAFVQSLNDLSSTLFDAALLAELRRREG